MTYQERFKMIIKRMKLDSKRYNDINIFTPEGSDEETIVKLCQYFWGNDFSNAEFNIRNDLDSKMANRKLDELEKLLDKMKWGNQ